MSVTHTMTKLEEYRINFMQNRYELKECLLLIQCIADRSGGINKTRFSKALARIQSQLISNLILLITKCFDKPDKKYPTVSIRSILELLKDSKDHIEITSIASCKSKLRRFGVNLSGENGQDNAYIVNAITDYFCCKIESCTEIINKLKDRRDKCIAHNEAIDPSKFKDLNWNEIKDLIDLIKEFREILDLCFFDKSKEPIDDLPSVQMSMSQLIKLIVEN